MATWYNNRNRFKKDGPKKATLATTDAQPKSPSARWQPSWTQLRFRMEMADELLIGWVESIGTYEFDFEDAECGNSAAPVNATIDFKPTNFAPVAGTRIDAQFIAINRTVQLAAAPVPAAPKNDLPMRHLQQLSVSSQFRLAASLG